MIGNNSFYFVTSLLILLSAPVKAEELLVVTLEYPPYEYSDGGEVKGIAVEIVREAFWRMRQTVKIKIYPWARALLMLQKGEADAAFTIYRTAERDKIAYFSNEILIPQVVSLYVRKGAGVKFDGDLARLKGLKFGVVRGVSYGEKFDSAVKRGVISKMEIVNYGKQNFLMLLSSRVDVVVSNRYGAIDIINRLGKQNEITELTPELQNVPSYIAFTKKKNYERVRDEFDRALRNMKRDGTYKRIISDYFKEIKRNPSGG